jgi:hypothetical protein
MGAFLIHFRTCGSHYYRMGFSEEDYMLPMSTAFKPTMLASTSMLLVFARPLALAYAPSEGPMKKDPMK